ncbi:hypothetical protein H4696_004961 [Amycolatopsis lexingtonensis]|uniref:Lipoprotein n=1 Tax=Amycolatopsis lexingtonensis TaxID=218822 RepID=A0ABR9I3W8_9PSEU|nr:hypothetical protein [Amycolatopsis lexingtonensis]MBE1497861.1 hypothetical protein [Amycolatopsis lexingtonensis]
MKFAPGLLGACLLLTACSGAPPAAPPTVTVTAPATPSAPATADPAVLGWMDGFCAVIHGYRERTNDEAGAPKPDPGSVAEAQQVLSATLGGIAARTGEVVDKLTALPPAPVPVAEKVRQAFVTKYTTARDRAAEAKKALDAAKPGDGASQGPAADAVKQAQQDIDGTYDPVAPMAESPELMMAAATAPGCKG